MTSIGLDTQYIDAIKALERGEKTAKTKIAWFLLTGYGDVKRDEKKAVEILEERVKEKDYEAMWILGICKEYGIGIEEDIEGAEKLYRSSNEGGNEVGKILETKIKNGRGNGKMKITSSLLKKENKNVN